jgi:chemotaxis protein CheC
MFLHVDFSLMTKDVNGYLAFLMDIVSARNFVAAVQSYLQRMLA